MSLYEVHLNVIALNPAITRKSEGNIGDNSWLM